MNEIEKDILLFLAEDSRRGHHFARAFNKKNTFCGHIGLSMNPTLSKQDLLEITAYKNGKVPQVGDVVLFQPPELDYPVVHRIVSISEDGIRTMGDNSSNTDPWCLKIEHIYGRVIRACYSNMQRRITGGLRGRLTGRYCHVRRFCMTCITNLLKPVYQSLCTRGSMQWLIPFRLNPQVAGFLSDTDTSYKLLLGKRIIGSYDESLLRWQINRPYRLLVDEGSLPTPDNHTC